MAYSLDGHSGQGWARLESGASSSIPCRTARTQAVRPACAVLSRQSTRDMIGVGEAGILTDIFMSDADIAGCGFNCYNITLDPTSLFLWCFGLYLTQSHGDPTDVFQTVIS